MASRAPRPSKGSAARRAEPGTATRAKAKQAAPDPFEGIDSSQSGAELIKAGLKALGIHHEAVTRHNRVFEALLGIDPSVHQRPVKELFKLPTFEDLFDERVARTLDRLGATPPLVELRSQLESIDQRLQRLEPRLPKRAPRAKR